MSILELDANAYHSGDFHERPALSRSIIREILTRSPLHAWANHPKLNPTYRRDDDGRFDLGTAAHRMFLEGDPTGGVVVLDFDDYKKKAAQEARDFARSLGKIPMLQSQWERANEVIGAIADGVAGIDADPPLFQHGKAELSATWVEPGDVLCKARFDWLHDDLAAIDDLKTTSRLAAPERIPGLMVGGGYDVQAAFYLRGLRACGGSDQAVFRFVFVETEPPYAVACYTPSPAMLALANQKIEFALSVWRDCLECDRWPGYPAVVMTVDPPGWDEARMYEREYREEAAA